ncbi:enoyl-CoA hydratase/isomerase family protein [Microbulbifer guangxiensis]|uniref:enoyl-CoA hydratase/isomerase family protein n=1 Tax=Microbulbifer guangxiensis TaxID=2904249 RepID=UPI001F030BCD|nr:enoyl-CoA hydratase-related protein [Microbulbifer guangxiensis]
MTALITEQRGCAMVVTLNRPELRNALNRASIEELETVLAAAESDPGLRALVIRGAGGHFCAGGDLADMLEAQQSFRNGDQKAFVELSRRFGRFLQTLERSRLVILSAVEGVAMGGGCGLVCASDIAVAAPGSRFSLPETRLGLLPAQIAPFLISRIGPGQTRRLVLGGETLDAAEALHIGLVHRLAVSSEELDHEINRFLANLQRSAPNALATTKALVRNAARAPADAQDPVLDAGAAAFSAALLGDEGREGALAFLEKRQPYWAKS